LREFHHVFPEESDRSDEIFDPAAELLCLPTNQKARCDLVATGEDVELEKDRLLNCFIDFAHTLCEKLRSAGYWADYIDPCSGLPMITRNHKVYSEVDGMECCLNYKSYNAGFCKVLQHPKWGTAVYPATIFARAPRHWVTQLLQEHVMDMET
jgi:Methylmalonic aciduria and homocystinuria type D protein